MTDRQTPIASELESHDAFDRTDDGYDLATTVFETTITADDAEGERDGRFAITVVLPTLDAAVADEVVADPVEDGWFETLERRLADVFTVAHTSTHDEPVVERDTTEVRVHLEYTAWDATDGVEDAKASSSSSRAPSHKGSSRLRVSGEAATLLENAQNRGQQAADGDGTSGGMPM